MNEENADGAATPDCDDPELKSRRDFLIGLGKWSKIIVGTSVFGGLLVTDRSAEAWIRRGGSWINRRGYGGGGWVNRRYGGGGWINGRGFGGGGGWINGRGYGGGGGWINRRGGGGSWINRRW